MKKGTLSTNPLTLLFQPPRCDTKDVCMAITESAQTSFVTRKCACPLGMFCPNNIKLASERVDLDRGAYYLMRCV